MAPYLKSGFKMRVQRTVVAELGIVKVTQKSSKSINHPPSKMQIQIQVALLSLSTVEHQKRPTELAVERVGVIHTVCPKLFVTPKMYKIDLKCPTIVLNCLHTLYYIFMLDLESKNLHMGTHNGQNS